MKRPPTGFWMSLPYILHVALFFGFPLVFSLILVFHRWDVYTPMQFSGWANLEFLFADRLFLMALRNTMIFLVLHIPLQIVIALGIASLLNMGIRGQGVYRTLFFMPVVVSGVVVTILFQQWFAFDAGQLNRLLHSVGIGPVPWLISEWWAMPSIALMATWKNVGLYVILFLAGLQSIPKSLYEAAKMDGANAWDEFRLITLPMLNPSFVTVAILSLIGGFSLFIEPYVMTGGGPMNATLSVMLHIYNQAFGFGQMGYGATLGVVMALIIFITVRLQKRWIEKEAYA
jgi:multiple sugar transport system permease protein